MSEQQFRITFQPSGRSVFVLPGTNIIEAAGRAGININTPCGGQGTCGKCRIQITSEAKETPCQPEKDVFSPEELQQGWRLACQRSTASDMTVYIPDDSLIFASQKILTESRGFGQITALMGFAGHTVAGDFNFVWAVPMVFVAVIGGLLGGRISTKTNPARLKKIFAYTTLAAAFFMAFSAYSSN